MTDKPEFAVADKAITFAAAKIEQAMVELLQTTLPLSHVVPTNYVVERLVHVLLERNPASLDWPNRYGATLDPASQTCSWTGGIRGAKGHKRPSSLALASGAQSLTLR